MKTILYIVKIDYKEFTFTDSTIAIEFAKTALLAASPTDTYDVVVAFKIHEDYETKKGGS